jgi:hypothetical protein
LHHFLAKRESCQRAPNFGKEKKEKIKCYLGYKKKTSLIIPTTGSMSIQK